MTAASGADRDEYDGHVGSCRMFYAERRCTCAGPGSANHGASGADQAFAAAAARWPHGDASNWPDPSGADQPTLRDQLAAEPWNQTPFPDGTIRLSKPHRINPLTGKPYPADMPEDEIVTYHASRGVVARARAELRDRAETQRTGGET